jgi:acyl-CoA reductase-like NAD-dependent aldehyde dehydrogenase
LISENLGVFATVYKQKNTKNICKLLGSEEQAKKVLSYIELAKAEGATVECGGERVILEGTYSTYSTY